MIQLGPDDIHVWSADSDICGGPTAAMIVLLGPDERARAGRLRSENDRERFIVSHAILRLVLGAYLGADPEGLAFETGDQGKPKLAGATATPCLSFNLSHSGARVQLAISSGPAVGIDVEKLRDDIDVLAMARLVLSPAELHVLQDSDAERQRTCFFRGWVRKEAVLKGCGLGFSGDPKGILVLRPHAVGESVIPVDAGAHFGTWGVRDVPGGDGYFAAVAAPGLDWNLRCFDHIWSERSPGTAALDLATAARS